MAFKLRTSKNMEQILDQIEASEHLPWYALVKLAMAMSIREAPLEDKELSSDTLGRELNRQTITGDADAMYKCLIELRENRHLTDEEFFPTYVKAHIDRGAVLLEQEHRYGSNFLIHLSELEKGI